MKKNGRKWRKLQEEKANYEKNRKVGEAFSKAKNRKLLCLHYAGTPGGIVPGFCCSKLFPINEKECKCVDCGKVFSMEKYEQMEQLVDYLSNKGCVTDVELIKELSLGIEPVHYRRLSETEIEIIDVVDDGVVMPNHICIT